MNAQKLSLPLLIVLAILPNLLVGQQTENSGCNSRRAAAWVVGSRVPKPLSRSLQNGLAAPSSHLRLHLRPHRQDALLRAF
jgi:hypothetical protein